MARNGLDPPRLLTGPWFLARGTELAEGATIELPPEERRHVRSRRLAAGEPVVVTDGAGRAGQGRLLPGGAAVVLASISERVGEPRTRVTVLLAASEPSRVEWAVEKGTECGAAAFLLVAAERSQRAHVRDLSTPHRAQRLERVAAEAAKQCRRSVVPGIAGPLALDQALRVAPRPLVTMTPGGPPLRADLLGDPTPDRLSILVGPEGGFSPSEEDELGRAGALEAGLGHRILRLETAVVAALVRLVDDED